MQKGNNEPQEIINEMKRKEQTQALDATDRAAIGAAGASAGAAGYYGAKLGADKVKQKLDFQQAMFEADLDDPFIYQEPPDIPEVEGGFGSPEQRKAASETSAGKRRVQTAIKPQDLFVPETGPGGERQSGFRHYMKTPGESNPNLGKMFDYVTEGTVPLMEEFENLNDPNVVQAMDPSERSARINALGNVLDEVAPNRTSRSEGRVGMARYLQPQPKALELARNEAAKLVEQTRVEQGLDIDQDKLTQKLYDIHRNSDYSRLELSDPEFSKLSKESKRLKQMVFNPSLPGPERIEAQKSLSAVNQKLGARLSDYKRAKPNFGYEDQYRKMVVDDFGKKIEMGLDNAKRYLDQRQVAKTLSRRRPEFMKGAIKGVGTAASLVPDPTDLAMLALAAPYEIMFETGIGEEPGTGTFDIPLANTLGNASRLLDKPLDSRELNEATRIRLAEDDYDLASALFNQDVLSKEAFDHVTGIRKSRGLDTTVLPEQKEKPKAPEPEPAMGRPGRRF